MDTVSYLTINDETKEIADLVSRNTIEDIATILEAQGNNIGQIQLNMDSNGTLMASVREIRALAQQAHTEAAAAEALAALIEERMDTVAQTVEDIQTQADTIEQTANTSLDQIQNVLSNIETSNEQITSIANAISVTQAEVDDINDTADAALDKANEAIAATEAVDQRIDSVNDTINTAQTSIGLNTTNINNTSIQLSTLESIVDIINWFINHSTVSLDTEVNLNKNYYIYNSVNNTIFKVDPIGTENPHEQNWYELNETLEDYLISNITEINNKIDVLPTSSRWKILISTDESNNTDGLFIVDPYNVIKQIWTSEGTSFSNSTPLSIGDDNAYMVFDGNNHLTIGGSGVNIDDAVTIGEENKSLSEIIEDLSSPTVIIEYGLSSSITDYSDITEWLTVIPEQEEGQYIWIRIFNGQEYSHFCLQGTTGPQGETGPQGATGVGITGVGISYGISDSELTIPSEDSWVSSFYELARVGSLGINDTDEYDYGYVDNLDELNEPGVETGITGETGWDYDLFTVLSPSLQGSWIWIRTYTEYSNGASTTTYQKSYIAEDSGNSVVTIIPTSIDWVQNTATLIAQLRVNGIITTPTSYYWTKSSSGGDPIGISRTIDITDLSDTYYCTVEWGD